MTEIASYNSSFDIQTSNQSPLARPWLKWLN